MTNRNADVALAVRASNQYGLISRDDARQAGLDTSAVYRRVRAGRWEVMAPGVWRIAGVPPSWEQHLRAGLLWLGAEAWVAGLAAAALWVFDNFRPGPIEFVVPRHRRSLEPGPYEVHTSTRLDPIDRTIVGGFPVTTASRTIIDLAARKVNRARLGDAIDSAVRDGHSSLAYLSHRIDDLRGPGRHGVRMLSDLMPDSGGHTRLERAFLALLRQHGLPRPTCQVIHRRDGVTVARVDFEFVPFPLVVEVSGRRGHVTERDRLRDAHRRNELQAAGFLVIEFLATEVFENPATVATKVREALVLVGALAAR